MPDTTRIDNQPQDMATGGAVLDARPGSRDADPRAQVRLGEMGLAGFPPYLMNRVIGRYNATLRTELAGLGLTTAKLRTLAVLSVIEGPLIRDLAAYTVTEQSTLSRALDWLAEDGLVMRVPVAGDRRATLVRLTAKGAEVFARQAADHEAWIDGMLAELSPEEARSYAARLRTLAQKLDDKGATE